jgi:predicted outer membrane protein
LSDEFNDRLVHNLNKLNRDPKYFSKQYAADISYKHKDHNAIPNPLIRKTQSELNMRSVIERTKIGFDVTHQAKEKADPKIDREEMFSSVVTTGDAL